MSNSSSDASAPWVVQDARNLYNINRWGAKYFDINEAGRVVAKPLKDANFVRIALLGVKLGKRVIMVVEKLEELRQIITVSKQLGVEPIIGFRARLLSKGGGRWAESAGENAKFGLSTGELLRATEMLKAEGLTQCFKLLHFHIGSQIPDILIVKR